MTPESWPWVFGSGTGVLGRVGPVKLPFGMICYHLVRGIVDESQLHCMPLAGIGGLEGTYRYIERQLLIIAGDGKVNLAGHSQTASHYLRFAALHPEKVGIVLSVAGPHFGSEMADRPVLKHFPCSKDMSRRSAYMPKVQEEFMAMLGSTPPRRRPRVICVAVYRDGVVLPWHSALMPGAENYVFSRTEPDKLPCGASWRPTAGEHNHFDVILSDETIKMMGEIVHSAPRRRRRSRVVQSLEPVARPIAA